MPINAYIPLIVITDQGLPNAMKLAQHVSALAADWNAVGDVSDYQPLATTPPATSPTGKGMFIWHLPELVGALAWAKTAGLSWVAIKVHNGPNSYVDPAQPNNYDANVKAFADAFRAAGIQVYGWGYCYLMLPESEANAAVLAVAHLGLDGYIIDAEGEAADAGPGPAAQFAGVLRAGIRKPIGLCSYRYPSLHMNFPWQALLSVCTFHCPQVYWLANTSPTGPALQLDRSVHELFALADLPIVPIGCAFPWIPPASAANPHPATWSPTVAQLLNFIEATRLHNLPGYAWWSWESAAPHPDWWAAIAGAAVG